MKHQMIVWLLCSGLLFISAKSDQSCQDCFNGLESLAGNETEITLFSSKEEIEKMCREAEKLVFCVKDEKICQNWYEELAGAFPVKGVELLLKNFCGIDDDTRSPLKTAYLLHSSCYEKFKMEINDCYVWFKKALSWIKRMDNIHAIPKETFCAQKWYESCVEKNVNEKCGKKAAETMATYTKTVAAVDAKYATPNSQCSNDGYSFEKLSKELCKQENFDNCSNESNSGLPPKEDSEAFLRAACLEAHSALHCSFTTLELCLTNGKGFRSESLDHPAHGRRDTEVCQVSPKLLKEYKKYEDDIYEDVKDLKSSANFFFSPLGIYTEETVPAGIAKEITCRNVMYHVNIRALDLAFRDIPDEALRTFKSIAVLSAGDLITECHFPEEVLEEL